MWLYGRTMMNPGYRGYLVADEKGTAEEAFAMVNTAYNGQPDMLKVKANLQGTRHLTFSNASRLKILYATKRQLGIGHSSDTLVLTEFGLWQNAARSMFKLAPTYRKRPHSKVLIESTPGPKGCLMETMCLNSMAGKGDWKHIFLDWTKDLTCTIPPPEGFEPDNGELAYIEKHPGITMGHIYFRRMLLEGEMKGDVRLFDNQYPPDPYSGFIVMGTPAIPLDALQKQLTMATVPEQVGEVWSLSERSITDRILIVVDPNGYGETGDPSAITVWDMVTKRLVAYWTGRIDPGLLANKTIRLQKTYGAEIVAVESNNSACIQSCVDKGCESLYHTSRAHPGFYMTQGSKQNGISKAVDMLRTGWDIGATEVLQQLYAYSSVDRKDGHHFDLAITVFIAASIMEGTTYLPRKVTVESPVGITRSQIRKHLKRTAK